MSSVVAVRRRTTVAVMACLFASVVVALAPGAAARSVSRADVVAAEGNVDAAARRLAEARTALAQGEQTVARLEATIARLVERQSSTAVGTLDQEAAIRTRIAQMYMAAGGAAGLVVADVNTLSARVAYLTAINLSDRDVLNRLVVSSRDVTALLSTAESRLTAERSTLTVLSADRDTRLAEWEAARRRLTDVQAEWTRQEAARIAAEEAELRRQEAELAAAVTTTTVPAGSVTTTTRPTYGYVPGGGVEQWRPVVSAVFARWGLDQTKCATRNGIEFCVGPQVDNALRVMRCESNGVPFAENPRSGAAGLFQNLPYYWQSRVDRVRAFHADKSSIPANASIWNPEYNTVVAALLVWESRETLLGNRGGGGVSPAVWPEFNWDRYASSGYGYSGWGKGPNPWGHWTCGSYVGVFDSSWVHPWASQQTPPE